MALKFNCSGCGQEIIVKHLKVGEVAKCRNCGAETKVPETAIETDEQSSIVTAKESAPKQAKMRGEDILEILDDNMEILKEPLASILERIRILEERVPKSQILSSSFWMRCWAIWGHSLIPQLIIGIGSLLLWILLIAIIALTVR
jgi:transcription elongation factor Elf1